MNEFLQGLALAVLPVVATQVGEGVRDQMARADRERARSRERWERLIDDARKERER